MTNLPMIEVSARDTASAFSKLAQASIEARLHVHPGGAVAARGSAETDRPSVDLLWAFGALTSAETRPQEAAATQSTISGDDRRGPCQPNLTGGTRLSPPRRLRTTRGLPSGSPVGSPDREIEQ